MRSVKFTHPPNGSLGTLEALGLLENVPCRIMQPSMLFGHSISEMLVSHSVCGVPDIPLATQRRLISVGSTMANSESMVGERFRYSPPSSDMRSDRVPNW